MGEDDERWKELCALAAKEKDADKLLGLVEEINELLEERESLSFAFAAS